MVISFKEYEELQQVFKNLGYLVCVRASGSIFDKMKFCHPFSSSIEINLINDPIIFEN